MHFDDRLATVLQMPASGQAIQRIQYRQLLDLLSQPPHLLGSGAVVDAAFARFEELASLVPATDRTATLRESTTRIANPELIARLVVAEPEVAVATIGAADMAENEWLELIPSLPVRARGILRHRRDLSAKVDAVLDRLGIGDRGLPAASIDAERPKRPEPPSRPELVVLTGGAAARPSPREETAPGIGAIVQRIEAFRKARSGTESFADEADQLVGNAGLARAHILSLDFTTDAQGRVNWADGVLAPALVGTNFAAVDADLQAAIRLAQPLRDRRITLPGAPELSGVWRLDALPRFGKADGRFLGYAGRLRRRATATKDSPADSMRQILHELRTPANAIQIAAEIIQQQLYGPAPHEYRALAAAIAGDTAQILAGFEELDRLVKLETGALRPAPGACDLAAIVRETVDRLHAWTNPRGSGFVLAGAQSSLPVAIDPEDTARLVWRLLAALASAAAPGETLALDLGAAQGRALLTIELPHALADRIEASLGKGLVLNNGQSLSAGMFGVGFTIRLAIAEATAAGGSLVRTGALLELQLPGLTPDAASHTHA